MRPTFVFVALAAAAITTAAACGSSEDQSGQASSSADNPGHLGDTVTAQGTDGPVKLTLTGVAYPDVQGWGDVSDEAAENGQYVVVSYKVKATEDPTTLGAPVDQAGFSLTRGSHTVDSTDGHASSPPWSGRTPEATNTKPVQPGQAQEFTETLDSSGKGGTLVYSSVGGDQAGTWKLPTNEKGPAAHYVHKAKDEFHNE